MAQTHEEQTDSELVEAWQIRQDRSALDALLRRYYPIVYRRLKQKVSNVADAQEITQDAFMKLVKSLDNYTDEGKFSHFLNTVVSSQLVDFYRKNGLDAVVEEFNIELHQDVDERSNDLVNNLMVAQKIEYLTKHCIPKLPSRERLVFLLMHESELWDFDTPLEWSHIAELNGVDKKTAWSRFESARESLMKGACADKVDTEELLMFLVWTEAKRPFKASHTLKYFANLLGEAEQNLRNRSHKAKKRLDECLANYAQPS